MCAKKTKEKLPSSPPSLSQALPHSEEMERALVAAVIRSPDVLEDIGLLEDDFHTPVARTLWTHCLQLYSQGKSPDLVMLMDSLEASGEMQKIGGPVGLANVAESSASTGMAGMYAAEVKGLARRRQLIQYGWNLASKGQDRTVSLDDLAGETQQMLDQVNDCEKRSGQEPGEALDSWINYLERLEQQAGGSIDLPFQGMKRIITGLFPGEISILAARPSNGKTAMALNILEWALMRGEPAAVFSLEMNNELLLNRMACARMGLDANKFRTGRLAKDDWGKIYEYHDLFKKHPVRLWDRPSLKPRELRAQCRKWKREMGLKFVIVDYLQLMSPDMREASREREVAEISRSIKQIAMEMDLSILLVCQLNREAEKSKKPLLSHLRESGSVEQDADNVLFIVPWPLGESEMAEVEINVAKGRNSATGSFKLIYHKSRLLFADPADTQEAPF